MRTLSLSGAALVLVTACGGGAQSSPPVAPPPSSAAPAAPSALPASSASPAPAASASGKPADGTSDAAHALPAKPDAASATDETKAREKLYRMTPHGLEVEMTGVTFRTRAKAVRRGAGWGVKVSVEVKSKDGKSHVLLAPQHGPLAFSAKVDRGGKVEKLGDTRKGDKLESVDQDKPLKLSRSWPDRGTKPVARGQSLDLQIGLWGLGPDAGSQRPVREFVEVKMVVGKGHAKPQAVVSPPASAK